MFFFRKYSSFSPSFPLYHWGGVSSICLDTEIRGRYISMDEMDVVLVLKRLRGLKKDLHMHNYTVL